MNKMIDANREFRDQRDWKQFHTPENLAKSISIESAELLECFQWNNNFNLEDVCDELADVMNYCILMADALNVNLEDIVLKKIEKNALKYPVEKAKGNSNKYNKI